MFKIELEAHTTRKDLEQLVATYDEVERYVTLGNVKKSFESKYIKYTILCTRALNTLWFISFDNEF